MNGLDSIAIQFYTAGTKYSTAIQPYALKLFFALLLIDILVTWIQFSAEGQLDGSYFLGRLIKHILSGGFVYLMIVNAFSWMTAVVKSFSAIGATITGLPSLSPQSVLQVGGAIATTIFDAPATASLMTNFELAIVQSVSAFVVLIAFVVTAAMLLLTLIETYLVVGGGVILLGLGAIYRAGRRRILRVCSSSWCQIDFLLLSSRSRRANGQPMECSPYCRLQARSGYAPLVDDLRRAAELDNDNCLLGESSCR